MPIFEARHIDNAKIEKNRALSVQNLVQQPEMQQESAVESAQKERTLQRN